MRWKLWRRRLSVSAPRVSVRSHLPWPVRWAVVALVLGFSGALALWAFDFGQRLAGLEPQGRQHLRLQQEQIRVLRDQVQTMTADLERLQSIANTADMLLKAEQVTHEKLAEQVRQLTAENQSLREDLGFFERLLPANPREMVTVRGVQAERLSPTQLRYQVLLMSSRSRNADFEGKLEIVLRGQLDGKPWTQALPEGQRDIRFRQYQRVEGVVDVPVQAVVQLLQVTVTDQRGRSATQNLKI